MPTSRNRRRRPASPVNNEQNSVDFTEFTPDQLDVQVDADSGVGMHIASFQTHVARWATKHGAPKKLGMISRAWKDSDEEEYLSFFLRISFADGSVKEIKAPSSGKMADLIDGLESNAEVLALVKELISQEKLQLAYFELDRAEAQLRNGDRVTAPVGQKTIQLRFFIGAEEEDEVGEDFDSSLLSSGTTEPEVSVTP